MNETQKLSIPISEDDHTIGPVNASVTVVTYGDYESPDCNKSHRQVERMFDDLLRSVQFVYRHFPLIRVHPRALIAAEAAEAAGAQGKFWEMHRLLYCSSTRLSDSELRHFAGKIGLDKERFDRDLESHLYRDRILKDYYNCIVNGISGAPTTFINGVLYPMSTEKLVAAIKEIVKAH